MSSPEPLLIVGASTRAAAASAVRAGYAPICADHYADLDLRQLATVLSVGAGPRGLVKAADRLEPMAWMYTGALENQPRLVDRISKRHHRLGTGPDALRQVRDPWKIEAALLSAWLPALPLATHRETPPADGTWLRKPRRGGGGRGVCRWDAAGARGAQVREPVYFQKFEPGPTVTALYLASFSQCLLLGTSRQFTSDDESYRYSGSVVPWTTDSDPLAEFASYGKVLSAAFDLRGLFGCDFILTSAGLRLVEINPRYTATTELFERLLDEPLLRWHSRACQSLAERIELPDAGLLERSVLASRSRTRVIAKRILYATGPSAAQGFSTYLAPPTAERSVADLPADGTRFASGEPICTVFADVSEAELRVHLADRSVSNAASVEELCLRQLADSAGEIRAHRIKLLESDN